MCVGGCCVLAGRLLGSELLWGVKQLLCSQSARGMCQPGQGVWCVPDCVHCVSSRPASTLCTQPNTAQHCHKAAV